MTNPQLVYPQNPLNSKVILVNVFGSLLTWAVAKYGLGAIFDPDTVNQVAIAAALAVMGAANIIMRKYTSGALSFDAPLIQPPPQELPEGIHTLTVTPQPSNPVAANVKVVSQPLIQ